MLVLIVVLTLILVITVYCYYDYRNRETYVLTGGNNSNNSSINSNNDNNNIQTDKNSDKTKLKSLYDTVAEAIKTLKTNKIKHGIDIEVNDNAKICFIGDIHGDLKTLQKAIKQKADYYVFTGDYIDKGYDNIGCLQLVLDLFISDSKHIVLLAGNHEKQFIYGTNTEIQALIEKYNICNDLIKLCEELFKQLPIGCLIKCKPSNKQIFCSHGAYPFIFSSPSAYEDNTTYSLSPTEYINKIYEDNDKWLDLNTYITWGDMYVNHYNTEFVKNNRGLTNYNICYPLSQLKAWMIKSNINVFIRGHQITSDLCQVYDINTNTEYTALNKIDFNDNTKVYITLHTTSFNTDVMPKILKLNDNCFNVISIDNE